MSRVRFVRFARSTAVSETARTGLIFVSHSSLDKDFVGEVIKRVPKSHLFYDVDTLNLGQHSEDALDDGLLTASVFVMFVSPNTPRSCLGCLRVRRGTRKEDTTQSPQRCRNTDQRFHLQRCTHLDAEFYVCATGV